MLHGFISIIGKNEMDDYPICIPPVSYQSRKVKVKKASLHLQWSIRSNAEFPQTVMLPSDLYDGIVNRPPKG